MSFKKVLVTGGSGFIGTNVVQYLMSKSDHFQVLSLDIEPPKNIAAVTVHKQVDLRNRSETFSAINEFKPDVVIHMAARTDLDGVSLDDYDSNTLGVKTLCEAIIECGTVSKFLVFSSMLVCGIGYYPKDDDDYSPTTIYGHSKVETELITKSFLQELPQTYIVRPTSIWGPWFGVPYRNFFDVVLAGKYFNPGIKSIKKTYGFIDNALTQVFNLVDSDGYETGKIFYLGDKKPINIVEWANIISRKAGKKAPFTMPKILCLGLAKFGDFLKIFGMHFPLTSFRLKNMTTENIIPANYLAPIDEEEVVSLEEGVSQTLNWINKGKDLK
ncbi:NAD-dependent epimerase/dehydratase family protein [Catenovulum sediminis]|uniref:NAD-dependent epimerase/dehydratase family protein n=1 Tax=Catenovulum sediminis TaxID=1740262 RepID=UPI00117CB054|nr:NAD(P)-dependent oxidoreductase [Catenovulum sediminis]